MSLCAVSPHGALQHWTPSGHLFLEKVDQGAPQPATRLIKGMGRVMIRTN